MRDDELQAGLVVRFLVPLAALFVLWMIFFAAMGHVGTVLVVIAFVALIVIPNRLHKPNGSGA
jgi:uncharacterized membrane protein YbhN (UPF0104 family)